MGWEMLYLERDYNWFHFQLDRFAVTSICHSPSTSRYKPNLCPGVGCGYDTVGEVFFPTPNPVIKFIEIFVQSSSKK